MGPFSGTYYEGCISKIKEYELENMVFLIGNRENPFPYYRSCDIYVQPSESEALPGTIIEASVLNKAIVSTDTIGGRELINDGYNGLICEYNPESIACSIIKLIENPELKHSLENNTHIIREKLENTKEEYYKLFS